MWFYGTLDVQIITVYIQQVPMSCCTVLSFFMVNLVNIRSASLMTHLGYVFHTKCGVCQLSGECLICVALSETMNRLLRSDGWQQQQPASHDSA